MEQAPTLSSGSVVFSIVHLREAIFSYHAHSLAQQRIERLEEIDRPVQQPFWNLTSSGGYRQGDNPPDGFFAAKLRAFGIDSNILSLLATLGLQPASYLDLLETRMKDVQLWLAACSAVKSSRKWTTPDGRLYRLGVISEADGRATVNPESARMSATEMLYHAGGGDPRRVKINSYGATWERAEGLAQAVRDHVGRIYLARVLDTKRQRFPFEAAAKRPELLYSVNSPFFPLYDVLGYNDASNIGIVLTECPPYALSQYLAPAQYPQRDELRRVLERMSDVFAHLVTLQEQGISLNGYAPADDWASSYLTSRPGPWFVAAYLEPARSTRHPGRLTRNHLYEERLPEPPSDAWPLAPLEGEGGLAGLPWSPLTAYSDPRVKGPTTYLHNAFEASWDDLDQSWTGYQYGRTLLWRVQAYSRFHCDLLNFTDRIVRRFFPLHDMSLEKVIQLLEAGTPAEVYANSLATGALSGPRDPASGHSGLFSFCANCIFQTRRGQKTKLDRGPDTCPVCLRHCMVNAMPQEIQDLLLRIVKPKTLADGTSIIVTAREALTIIRSVMATELPKIVSTYELWARNQPRVERMETVDPLPLDKIRGDARAERWLLFEHLRGNYLDAKFTRQDRKENRDLVKAHLGAKKQRDAGLKAKEETDSTAATVAPACDADSPLTDAEEVEVPLTATQEEVRKRGGDEDAGQATAKKMKTT